jgi:hypothetical protein
MVKFPVPNRRSASFDTDRNEEAVPAKDILPLVEALADGEVNIVNPERKSEVINVSEINLAKPLPDLPMGVELWGDSFIFSCI